MILRRVVPAPLDELDLDAEGARQLLRAWYAPTRPDAVRLNLVTTLDGRFAGDDGTSGSLTAGADRMILGVIRESADVVLVGAQSVRAEGYRLPRRAQLAVVTASGDLSGHGFAARGGAAPVVVMTTTAGESTAHRALDGVEHIVVTLPSRHGRIAAVSVLEALRERGAAGIVCEGGPSLAAQVLETGWVDELCLTTVPRWGGAGIPSLGAIDASSSRWAPRQLITDDDGVLYARWAPRAD